MIRFDECGLNVVLVALCNRQVMENTVLIFSPHLRLFLDYFRLLNHFFGFFLLLMTKFNPEIQNGHAGAKLL